MGACVTAKPFRLKAVDPLEHERQAGIIRYLQLEKRVRFFIRINGGGRLIGRVFVWFYKLFFDGCELKGKGVSDIIGQLRDGRFFALEVKRPGEKPTEEQAAFLSMVEGAGGVAGVVCNWMDAKTLLEKSPDFSGVPPAVTG